MVRQAETTVQRGTGVPDAINSSHQPGDLVARFAEGALHQLRGPIALQDLPQGAPVLRVRAYL